MLTNLPPGISTHQEHKRPQSGQHAIHENKNKAKWWAKNSSKIFDNRSQPQKPANKLSSIILIYKVMRTHPLIPMKSTQSTRRVWAYDANVAPPSPPSCVTCSTSHVLEIWIVGELPNENIEGRTNDEAEGVAEYDLTPKQPTVPDRFNCSSHQGAIHPVCWKKKTEIEKHTPTYVRRKDIQTVHSVRWKGYRRWKAYNCTKKLWSLCRSSVASS